MRALRTLETSPQTLLWSFRYVWGDSKSVEKKSKIPLDFESKPLQVGPYRAIFHRFWQHRMDTNKGLDGIQGPKSKILSTASGSPKHPLNPPKQVWYPFLGLGGATGRYISILPNPLKNTQKIAKKWPQKQLCPGLGNGL